MDPKTELQKNVIVNERKAELSFNRRVLGIQRVTNKMEDDRMSRSLSLIKKEAEMEKKIQETTDHAVIVNARAKKETALGIEVANVSREKACELLRRQYLREKDHGLKELMKKLKAGYVCRDIQHQILNNEYKRLQEKAAEQHANSVLNNARISDDERKFQEEKIKQEKASKYRMEIHQQLVGRQRVRQCQYEDTLKEKKMLEDIMRTMADEDQREIQQKRELTEKMRQEMLTSRLARDAWKEKQKQMIIIEEQNIEKQRLEEVARRQAGLDDREYKLKMREEANAKIGAKILAGEESRQEHEELIRLLQEQEFLEKNVQQDLATQAKLERDREDAMQILRDQDRLRRQRQRDKRENDLRFQVEMEAKVAADNKKEEEKELKKREKARKHSQELLQQIKDNEKRRKQDKMLEDKRAQNVLDTFKLWDEEVKEERSKIVENHAPPVLGFLQAGVLRRDDLPALARGAPHVELGGLHRPGAPLRQVRCNAQCRLLREY